MKASRLVNSADAKNIEGQRLTALFGAIGALPAAALVALGSEGSPLFAAAIVLVVGAYMFWVFTDAVYIATHIIRPEDPEWAGVLRLGYGFQWSSFVYGAGSVSCTILGFAAEHSTIRTSISVNQGFIVVGLLAVMALIHGGLGSHWRNAVTTLSLAVAARKAATPT